MAAKTVLNKGRYDNPTRYLENLHWLHIQQMITFKILTLVFKCIHRQAPSYLEQTLSLLNSKEEKDMRSGKQTRILEVLHTSKKMSAVRSFSVKGPEYWNSSPKEIRRSRGL